MEKIFFAEKNINKLQEKINKELHIKTDDATQIKCKIFLVNKMKTIYNEKKKNFNKNVDPASFITDLNILCLQECIGEYVEKINKKQSQKNGKIKNNDKSQYASRLDDFARNREIEIYGGQRNQKIEERPVFSATPTFQNNLTNNQENNKWFNRQYDIHNIPQMNEFISAYGSRSPGGLSMEPLSDKKQSLKAEMDKKMMELASEYRDIGMPKNMNMPQNIQQNNITFENNDNQNVENKQNGLESFYGNDNMGFDFNAGFENNTIKKESFIDDGRGLDERLNDMKNERSKSFNQSQNVGKPVFDPTKSIYEQPKNHMAQQPQIPNTDAMLHRSPQPPQSQLPLQLSPQILQQLQMFQQIPPNMQQQYLYQIQQQIPPQLQQQYLHQMQQQHVPLHMPQQIQRPGAPGVPHIQQPGAPQVPHIQQPNNILSNANIQQIIQQQVHEQVQQQVQQIQHQMQQQYIHHIQKNNNLKVNNDSKINNVSKNKKLKSNDFLLDLEILQQMSSKEIQHYIDKLKYNVEKKTDKSTSEDIDGKIKTYQNIKKETSDMLNQLKQFQNKILNNDILNDSVYKSDNSVEKPGICEWKTKNSSQKSLQDNDIIYDNIDAKDYSTISTSDNINIKNNIIIKSENYTTSEYYNDYIAKFDKSYNNIKTIILHNYKIPKNENNITKYINNFIVKFKDGESKTIVLYEQKYDINELISSIQEGLDSIDNNLSILIKNNKIMISHNKNTSFEIICGENTINHILGFHKNSYCDSSLYIAESQYNLSNNIIYLYLNNIQPHAFASIDLDKEPKKIIVNYNTPINKLSEFTIAFKTSDYSDGSLYDFDDKPHILCFDIF